MHSLKGYFAASWAARTWRAVGYLFLGFPVSLALFTYAVTFYAVGAALAIVWVGVGLLVVAQMSMRPIGAWERLTANAFIGAQILSPPPFVSRGEGKHKLVARLGDQHAWRVLLWILARGILGPLGFAAAILAVVLPISLVAAVILAFAHVTGLTGAVGYTVDAEAAAVVDTVAFWVAVGSPVVLLAAAMPAWFVRGLAVAHGALARWALGMCDRDIAKEATARASLAEEQVRIDQELHDSIGHMITMNIVQAGAGAHVFDADPEFARQALKNIEERGRAAMGELDRILATIRGDAGERAPLRGIGDIPALIEASRDAGISVDAHVDTTPVPAALGRAAFGIVRESLTNAARHAPGAAVTVTVVRVADALGIDISNAASRGGPVGQSDRPRHGVSGMRDRVTLLGGRTIIGPEPDGGFRVRAVLPLNATLSEPTISWQDLREEVRA